MVSGAITISGTAADNVALSQVQLRIDGGAFNLVTGLENWTYGLDTTALSNGNHTITVRATDASGNTQSVSISINVDNTAPVISNIAANNITINSAVIAWNTNEAGNSQVEYGLTTSYGNSTTLDSSMVTSHSQNLSGLTPSTLYHYRVKSKDALGNLAISGDYTFTTVTPDTTLPTVVITYPANGAAIAGAITISGTAADNVALSKVEVQIDGGAFNLATGLANWTYGFNTTAISSGNYTITAKATDPSGNSQTALINIIVDNLSPMIFNTAASNITINSAVITWNTNEGGDSQVEYGLTTSYGNSTTLDSSMVLSHSQNLSGLNANKLYHFRVKSKDALGNLAVSGDYTLTTAGNLIANPGFESSKTNWSFPSQGSIDTAFFHSGTKSAKLKRTSSGTSYITSSPNVAATAQASYVAQIWIKRTSVVLGSGGKGARVLVRWFNSSNSLLREDAIATDLSGTANWTFFSANLTAPGNATQAQIRLILDKSNGTVWYDDVMLYKIGGGGPMGAPQFDAVSSIVDDVPQDPDADSAFKLDEFYAFPNPAIGGKDPIIHVECGIADSVDIRIYNEVGEKVHEAQLTQMPQIVDNKYAYEYIWNVSDVASGVYIYSVTVKKAGENDIKLRKKLAIVK